MIEALRIERLAVVESAELELGPGLNVLTGETGAGKSLVLAALGLLAGARAQSDTIREGADDAVVEAVFRTSGLPALEAALDEHALGAEEGALVVRRHLSRSGRHRVRVGGALVPLATLAELFGGRLEISSQHESQALLRPEQHAERLDAFGGLGPARRAVAETYAALRALDDEVAALREAAEDRARQEDYLAFQVAEIEEAKLVPGELGELGAERSRLVHAERLEQEVRAAAAALNGDPVSDDGAAAGDLVSSAARRLREAAALDPSLEPLAARLEALHVEVGDVGAELEQAGGAFEADPARLEALDDRLEALERLRRKYGADEAEILAFRDRAAAELEAIRGAESRLAERESARAGAADALESAAAKLGQGRKRGVRKLEQALASELERLAMPHARFEIALPPAPAPAGFPSGPNGREAPEFLFSANPGEPPRALRKVASGGELSRVFLALKNVLRKSDPGMVLVFDEVDAGLGGAVADRVGEALAELARSHQVLCITHLPQIAARAELHFRVSKQAREGRTFARVERLEGAERIEEIARMAGGERVSDTTRRHARELLATRGASA